MKRFDDSKQLVQLDPATLELVRVWLSVTVAARILGGTREGLYQATRDGSVRYGFRWMFYDAYKTWERTHAL